MSIYDADVNHRLRSSVYTPPQSPAKHLATDRDVFGDVVGNLRGMSPMPKSRTATPKVVRDYGDRYVRPQRD